MWRKKTFVVVGGGGFGREIYDLFLMLNRVKREWKFVGFVAPDRPDVGNQSKVPWLGSDDDFMNDLSATHFVVAIADPKLRRSLADRYEGAGLTPATFVHPSAEIGSDVSIGPGSLICSGANLTTNVTIGKHVIIDRLSSIGHDAKIGNFATVWPGSVLAGGVTVEDGALLGTRSCILPSVTVRKGSVVGAGAVVTKDVPENSVVAGVPARVRHYR